MQHGNQSAHRDKQGTPTMLIPPKSTRMSSLFIFGLCLVFRLFNAFLTRTYDNPDEYWQAQEVAHAMVFGYGYMTWEWTEQIRSYAHPLLFAFVYKVLAWLHLDGTRLLIIAPKVVQACLAAVADHAIYTLGKKVAGQPIAPYILFMTLCSWYNFFMAGRTLSNAMEMVLTTVALKYWPLNGLNKTNLSQYRVALLWASIACVMRPTNGLVWLFLGTYLFFYSKGYRWVTLANAAVIVSGVMLVNIAIDTHIYTGSWQNMWVNPVLTPLNFFKLNVVASVSLFYGVHPWHWYISQGVPVILTTILPLAIYGYRVGPAKNEIAWKTLGRLVVWVLTVYSLLSHKEFRFIYPILPILLLFAAVGLSRMSSKWRKPAIYGLLFTQLPMALYLSLYHQRGVTDAMLWLRNESQKQNMSVGVLMPCHSTPWQSVMHQPDVPMWFLTCEPPLTGDTDEMDEADQFYADPVAFIDQHLGRRRMWPSHLLVFDNLLDKVGNRLTREGYTPCQRFFNSHFHDDRRRKGDVVVLCKKHAV